MPPTVNFIFTIGGFLLTKSHNNVKIIQKYQQMLKVDENADFSKDIAEMSIPPI